MPGVMDIKHLLCHPCDPYSSFLLRKNDNNVDILLPSASSSYNYYYQEEEGEKVEFWRHGRSNSTQSISNCSQSSNSSVYSTLSSSTFSILKNQQQQRRRVNSEMTTISPPPQSSLSTNSRRSRSNSTTTSSFIQTRTPWTPKEDELLQKGYEQGLSWAMISFNYLPHRSRGCCWGRFKTLQSKNVIAVYHQQRICQRPWKINSKKREVTE